MKHLVVLGSSTTALAVARHGHDLGLGVLLADDRPGIAFDSRRAGHVLLAGGEADRLRDLAAASRGGAVIATGDEWLRFVRRNRPALGRAFGRILHPADAVLDVCLDKLAFARWCVDRGIPTPAAAPGNDPAALGRLRFPLLVRPAETAHSGPRSGLPKALNVEDPAGLGPALDRFHAQGERAVVTESLLGRPLDQFSVPFVRQGGATAAYVARKLRPLPESCRVGTYVETAPDPDVLALATRLVAALDYDGMGEVEILRDLSTGALTVIEVNARPWSQYAMSRKAGYDFLGAALGGGVGAPAGPVRPVSWVDFTSDLYMVFSRSEGMIAAGRLSPGAYLASLLRVNAWAKLDLADPRPFFADLASFLGSRFR